MIFAETKGTPKHVDDTGIGAPLTVGDAQQTTPTVIGLGERLTTMNPYNPHGGGTCHIEVGSSVPALNDVITAAELTTLPPHRSSRKVFAYKPVHTPRHSQSWLARLSSDGECDTVPPSQEYAAVDSNPEFGTLHVEAAR